MRAAFLLVPAIVAAAELAAADALVANRTIRPREVILPSDVSVKAADIPGALVHPSEAVGLEARVALYAGRPIRAGAVGPPALVERNQIVTVSYVYGALAITAEARALERGGAGERIRVMNLSSRTSLHAVVRADGSVHVDR
ncbi:flagellar basal body P-ring formation chaperone FlgA [Rhodosalinus sp. 5P4]|uniref:flagellar basal body P-ring formation chaperone FlgA n=1 Tax=Rhodosalinus sp. 5P4 TaxID=3239196 RepID=UPI0035257845